MDQLVISGEKKREDINIFNQESWKIKPKLLRLMNTSHYLLLMVPLCLTN